MSNVNDMGPKNRAELYRVKAANFKKLKVYFTAFGILDLVMAVVWIFLMLKKSPGAGFAEAYRNEPVFFWVGIFFAVTAIFAWLFIPLLKRLMFKEFEGEDFVE